MRRHLADGQARQGALELVITRVATREPGRMPAVVVLVVWIAHACSEIVGMMCDRLGTLTTKATTQS